MNNSMNYKSYAARREFSSEDDCFVGHIAGIRDVVGFHADSVDGLKQAFHEAVDDYLETCELVEKSPQQPYSGKLMLRMPPEIHAAIASAAQVSGKSINQWASETLGRVTTDRRE